MDDWYSREFLWNEHLQHVDDACTVRYLVTQNSNGSYMTVWLQVWQSSNSNSTTFQLRTSSADSKFVECFKCFFDECKLAKKSTLYNWFHRHNKKQISDIAGPRLSTNAVSLTQCAFGSDRILAGFVENSDCGFPDSSGTKLLLCPDFLRHFVHLYVNKEHYKIGF